MKTFKKNSRADGAGVAAAFTLLENMVACAIVAVALAATYTLNAQTMSVLRMAKEEAAASQVLQQRIEHLRIGNWQRISSPVWIRNAILNVPADGSQAIPTLVERVIVSPLTSATGNTFERNSAGTTSAGSGNASYLDEAVLSIRWVVTWTGVPRGKTHQRETVVILGKGGVAK